MVKCNLITGQLVRIHHWSSDVGSYPACRQRARSPVKQGWQLSISWDQGTDDVLWIWLQLKAPLETIRVGPGGRYCRLKISSWKRFEGLVPKWSLDICASSLNCVQLRHWITLMLLLNQIRLMLEEVVLVDI